MNSTYSTWWYSMAMLCLRVGSLHTSEGLCPVVRLSRLASPSLSPGSPHSRPCHSPFSRGLRLDKALCIPRTLTFSVFIYHDLYTYCYALPDMFLKGGGIGSCIVIKYIFLPRLWYILSYSTYALDSHIASA